MTALANFSKNFLPATPVFLYATSRRLIQALLVFLFAVTPFTSQAQNANDELIIGLNLPLTGPWGEIGISFAQGFKSCLVTPASLENKLQQQFSNDAETQSAKQDFEEWFSPTNENLIALVGVFGDSNVAELMKKAIAAKVPLVAPMSGALAVMQDDSGWVFPIRSSNRSLAATIVNQAATLGIKRLALLAVRDPAGNELTEYVKRAAVAAGVEIVAVEEVATGSIDLQRQAKALLAAQPQAVLSLATYVSTADLFLNLRKQEFGGMLFAHGDVGSRPLVRAMGQKAARGIGIGLAVPSPVDAALPLIREFQAAMRKSGGAIDEFSLEGCMAGRLFSEGLRRTGPGKPTRESLRRGLESIKSIDMGGVRINLQRADRERNRGELVVLGADGRILR